MEKKARLFRIFFGLAAAAGLCFASCATPPDYPVEPALQYISLSKDTLRRGSNQQDTTFVTFSFTDGDGDIGSEDSLQLVLTDSRDNTPRKLKIPFVPELGASNGIKGKITARLFTTCCIFPEDLFLLGCEDELASMPYDKVVYSLYITDRAGHQSNIITIDPIYVECFN